MRTLVILILGLTHAVIAQESCRTYNGDAGNCILLETCKPFLELNKKKHKSKEDIQFLRQVNCGLHLNSKPKVCCPPDSQWEAFKPPSTIQGPDQKPSIQKPPVEKPHVEIPEIIDGPSPEVDFSFNPPYSITCLPSAKPPHIDSLCCGKESGDANRIIGGKDTKIDQYPWLVLLEYDSTGRLACGGTLISSKYVLTAAHCLGNTIHGTATKVRLAEYNISTYPIDTVETDGGGIDTIEVLILRIIKQIPHPEFDRQSKKNDIGLVKLIRDAPYTEFIRPICLPTEDMSTKRLDEQLRFFVAGWGSNGTHFAEVKQDVLVPYVPLDVCQKAHSEIPRTATVLNTKQICAGGEKNRDSCSGDSGGPLMYEYGDTFVIVGVVSFGLNVCGTEGAPGVYTHVYKYLDWIKSQTK